MHVSGLMVRNFRSLQCVNLAFQPGLNVLVGKNNAGKTNIIRALDYVLGEKWPTYREIEQRDFFASKTGDPESDAFLIAVRLGGRDLYQDLLAHVKSKVMVRHLSQAPNWNDLTYFLHQVESDGTQEYWYYGDLGRHLALAEHLILFLAVPREGQRADRVFGLVFKEGQTWHAVPRFAGELRDALITTAYVPAFRDPESELRITQWNWYGKLIRNLYTQGTEEQHERMRAAEETQSATLREIFESATEQLRTDLEKAIFHYGLSFEPSSRVRNEEHKQIMIFIDDGLHAPFYEKGSGIQSALIIALFSLYCERFHRGSSLLLVEEPEIYLHPQARRAVEARLVSFSQPKSDASSCSRQVIISTHSPEFLRSASLRSVTLVRKALGQTATDVLKLSQNSKTPSETRIAQIVETRNAEAFFADHVILVEGGEEYLIPPLADLVMGENSWLDFNNISVARVNGKGQFRAYVDLLDSFGISWSILTDLDFLTDGVDHFSGCLDASAQAALGRIRLVWQQSPDAPKGRDIKDKVFNPETRDWRRLYEAVNTTLADLCSGASPSNEQVEQMRDLWDSLANRVRRFDHQGVREGCSADIAVVLAQLRRHGVYVLSQGELEDYFTQKALGLATSKDLRAIEVGKEMATCSSLDQVEQWLAVSEWAAFLCHVRSRAGLDQLSAPT